LKSDDKEFEVKFNDLKENVVNKLNTLKSESTDFESQIKINETIEKVSKEKYDKYTYFKLMNLNENI